jgi:hypothetical protein
MFDLEPDYPVCPEFSIHFLTFCNLNSGIFNILNRYRKLFKQNSLEINPLKWWIGSCFMATRSVKGKKSQIIKARIDSSHYIERFRQASMALGHL